MRLVILVDVLQYNIPLARLLCLMATNAICHPAVSLYLSVPQGSRADGERCAVGCEVCTLGAGVASASQEIGTESSKEGLERHEAGDDDPRVNFDKKPVIELRAVVGEVFHVGVLVFLQFDEHAEADERNKNLTERRTSISIEGRREL